MTFKEALRAAGKAYLERVIAENPGKVEAAAMAAGLSRTTLYRTARKYGVELHARQYRKRS